MFLVGQQVTVNESSDLVNYYAGNVGKIVYMGQEFNDPYVYKIVFPEMPVAWLFESELTLVN